MDTKFGTKANRLFYLAVAPEYFSDIVKFLGKHNMNKPTEGEAVGAHGHREAVRARPGVGAR
jgi:glucose-6-phosphate 1-dehydrogenase